MRTPHCLPLALAALGAVLGGCSGGGASDIEKLLADLTGPSARARARAERTLAEHGRSVIKPLSNLVTLNKDAEKTAKDYGIKRDYTTLRIPAARALGVIAAKASLARSEAETAAAPLLEVLRGSDRELRLEAARALSFLSPAAVSASDLNLSLAFRAATRAEARDLRAAAAEALGFFSQLSAPANDLILTFREDDERLAAAATEALARNALRSVYFLAPPQEPPAAAAEKDWDRLRERIASTDDDIRLDTVRELAASRDPRAAPMLLERVAKDKNRDVRYAALCHCIEALNSGKPDGFPDALFAQLPLSFARDDDSRVVLSSARLLRDPGKAARLSQPVEAVTRNCEAGLFAVAASPSLNAGARADAIETLALLHTPERVSQFLQRVEAATRRCEEKLSHDAADRRLDAGARADAIEALVLLPGERRDELLARLLDMASGERVRIRRAAAGVLATSESPIAANALKKAMGDDDSMVRLVAAQALGRGGALDAVKYLVDLLRDDEGKIRADASDALGTLVHKDVDGTLRSKALPVLIKHLEDTLPFLGSTGGEGKAKYTAWGIVAGLGRIAEQIGPEAAAALDVVAAAADCGDPDVRRVAAVALAHFPGDKAIAALAKRLKDADDSVQWHALAALEKHGREAIPALVAALRDDPLLPLAAGALGRVGDAESLKPLLERLGTAQGDAKAELAWAIGEVLRRNPESRHAAAARSALEAASKLGDDSELARTAAYALLKLKEEPPPSRNSP